jgi:hypothetical protein
MTRSTIAQFLFGLTGGLFVADPVPVIWKPQTEGSGGAMNIEQALDDAAHASHARLRKSYEVALAHGATDTGCRAEEERMCGTLRLITLAILRLPDLALLAQLIHADSEDRLVLRAARDVAGGALRLAHRALERNGRDAGTWATRSARGSTRRRLLPRSSSPASTTKCRC